MIKVGILTIIIVGGAYLIYHCVVLLIELYRGER